MGSRSRERVTGKAAAAGPGIPAVRRAPIPVRIEILDVLEGDFQLFQLDLVFGRQGFPQLQQRRRRIAVVECLDQEANQRASRSEAGSSSCASRGDPRRLVVAAWMMRTYRCRRPRHTAGAGIGAAGIAPAQRSSSIAQVTGASLSRSSLAAGVSAARLVSATFLLVGAIEGLGGGKDSGTSSSPFQQRIFL